MNTPIGPYISRQETQAAKGLAILFMLFYHLFFLKEYIAQCSPLVFIGDYPLVYLLSRCTNPVSFFLILGGYGMYIVTEKGDKHKFSRVFKLLLHYWVITLLFLLCGCLMMPDVFPGSWREFVENIFLYRNTYNAAMWFMLPYIIITLSAKWLFGHTKQIPSFLILGISLVVFVASSYLTTQYAELLNDNTYYWLNIPIRILRLQFAFMLGGIAARDRLFSKVKALDNSWMAWVGFVAVFVAKIFVKSSSINDFYAFALIFLFLKTKRPKFVDKTLQLFGDHSMNIWMIHNWIYINLFTSFIFGFKLPLLVWIALLLVSLACSYLVDLVCKQVETVMPFGK